MGRKRKPTYAWDTTIMVAWLGGEPISSSPDMQAVVGELDNKDAVLVVPVHLYTEVLEAKRIAGQMRQFREFLLRSNVTVVNIAMKMALKAEEIRSAGHNEKPPKA